MLLGFLIFVVLLSGLVAYSADTIARRAGRRHLRLFGLRPKTTALIVAVASGMGISLASVLAFGVINRAAISNIEQADRLRAELSQLKVDVRATTTDLRAAQQQRDEANARLNASRQETGKAVADLQDAEKKLNTTQAARRTLQNEVTRLSAQQQDLEVQARRNRQALIGSQRALDASRGREQVQSGTLNLLSQQIVELDKRSAQTVQDAKAAQNRAQLLQVQTQALETSRARVAAQLLKAQRGRDQALREGQNAERDRQIAVVSRDSALQARDQALQGRLSAVVARDAALAARDVAQVTREKLATERAGLIAQRAGLIAQRNAAAQDLSNVRRELGTLQTMIGTLEEQRRALSTANDTLRSSLSSAQTNLTRLEVDYSRTTSELSANRNTDLIYSRNELVYAAVVPSVRSVPDFLQAASAAAQKQGARGSPAAQLSSDARATLDNKLRGLNTNTFVQCRAAVNVATGFPVDLTCDARPQSVLFRRGQIIRQSSVSLQRGTELQSSQITDLVRDAVLDLTSRGVPLEYINDLGLSDTKRLELLGKLGAQSGANVVVGLAARDDVRPGTRVDLYPVLK